MSEHVLSPRARNLTVSEIRKMFGLADAMENVLRLEAGEPDFDTPAHIREAAQRAIAEGKTHYTSSKGTLELREAIAEKLKRENDVEADPVTEIIVSNGGVGALIGTILALVGEGDQVIVSDPAWAVYRPQIQLAQGEAVGVKVSEEDGFELDPQKVEEAVTERTKLLIINTPANPTGCVMDQDTLFALGKLACERDFYIITDEVYEKILYDGAEHFSLASVEDFKNRVVTINSASKTYAMTGWRVGYAAGPENIMEGVKRIQEPFTSCPNSIAQEAAVAALRGPQGPVEEMVARYSERRELVMETLAKIPGITCAEPRGSFYAFVNVKSLNTPSTELAKQLLEEEKVCMVPGSGFGPAGEGYLRLSYATSETVLKEALARFKKFVERRYEQE